MPASYISDWGKKGDKCKPAKFQRHLFASAEAFSIMSEHTEQGGIDPSEAQDGSPEEETVLQQIAQHRAAALFTQTLGM